MQFLSGNLPPATAPGIGHIIESALLSARFLSVGSLTQPDNALVTFYSQPVRVLIVWLA
ncbi:hypothetical protein BDR04DRAFT_1165215 [Suillus decipiens]|nr:hypothetical protein BDR04DRAFT_1165215 [Suillus decipiens]